MNKEEIKELIISKLLKKEKHEPSEDKVWVTEIVYDCLRKAFYERKFGREFHPLSDSMYMAIGDLIHSVPVLKHNELELEWNGIVGKIDDYEDGVLIEKKTCRKIPQVPNEHHVKQVEFYSILLKKNNYPLEKMFIAYIDVVSGKVEVFEVTPRGDMDIETEMLLKKEILLKAIKEGKPPERNVGWLCNYCPFAKLCFGE